MKSLEYLNLSTFNVFMPVDHLKAIAEGIREGKVQESRLRTISIRSAFQDFNSYSAFFDELSKLQEIISSGMEGFEVIDEESKEKESLFDLLDISDSNFIMNNNEKYNKNEIKEKMAIVFSLFKSVNLGNNKINNDAAQMIGQAIILAKDASTIQNLNLSGNSIKKSGGITIANAIGEQKSLRCIDLSRNSIGVGSGLALKNALIDN